MHGFTFYVLFDVAKCLERFISHVVSVCNVFTKNTKNFK